MEKNIDEKILFSNDSNKMNIKEIYEINKNIFNEEIQNPNKRTLII